LCFAYGGGLTAIARSVELITRFQILNQLRDLMIRRNGFLRYAPDLGITLNVQHESNLTPGEHIMRWSNMHTDAIAVIIA
jgi:hypothetical protein